MIHTKAPKPRIGCTRTGGKVLVNALLGRMVLGMSAVGDDRAAKAVHKGNLEKVLLEAGTCCEVGRCCRASRLALGGPTDDCVTCNIEVVVTIWMSITNCLATKLKAL